MGLHECLKQVRGFLSRTTRSPRENAKRPERRAACWRQLVLERLEDRICPTTYPWTTIVNELTDFLGPTGTVQTTLTKALNTFTQGTSQIPFVGDKLGNATQVVTTFENQLE